MRGINKLFLMGCLGTDPQTYQSKSGKEYVGLNLATHRNSTANGDGSSKETTDWHFVRVFGKSADHCRKYLAKGAPVFIEGYLTQYQTDGEEGQKEKRTGINAVKVEFLPKRGRAPASADAEI